MRALRRREVDGRPMVLAISGGADSMVLLNTMSRLRPLVKSPLIVTHIHHGSAANLSQLKFRDRAKELVRNECRRMKLPFYSVKARKKMTGENEFRKFRYAELEKVRKAQGERALIVTAHHSDDLLETQMLRLVRGTTAAGLVGFEFLKGNLLRPFVEHARAEVLEVKTKLKIKVVEDPSNNDFEPLRNWMRHKWLPDLEKKISGGTKALARSLQSLAETAEPDVQEATIERHLTRQKFMALTSSEKRLLVVKYIRSLGVFSYTQGQIEEIVRRLDNRRVDYKFTLLKHVWRVNAEQIKAAKSHS